MSLLSDIRQTAISRAHGFDVASLVQRDFPPGMAGIPMEYTSEGVDTSFYTPESYGNYLFKSNPIFAVIWQRATFLSSLPLRLFKFTNEMAQHNIPRMLDNVSSDTRDILRILDQRGYLHNRAGRNMSTRNAILGLSAAATRGMFKFHMAQRKMGVEEINDGGAFETIHYMNPHWTLTRALMMTEMSLGIWGASYFVAERGPTGRGRPRELWWVKPTAMHPIVDPNDYIVGYEYEPISGGERIPFRKEEVVRIYYPNPMDEFQAISPLALARIYADHEHASMKTNLNLHKQGLMPGAIVAPKHPTRWKIGQARQIERMINERYGGYDKSHRWAVFRHDVAIHSQGITPQDAQFLEGMEYDIERIANAYNWPVDLLSGKRTYENVDQAHKVAWTTMGAEGTFIAAELTEQLLPMFNDDSADVFFFDTSGIAVLQEDEERRWNREKGQIDLVITRNEWRAAHGLPPVENGDELYINEQMVPVSSEWALLPSSVQPAEIGGPANADELAKETQDPKDSPEVVNDQSDTEPSLSLNGAHN